MVPAHAPMVDGDVVEAPVEGASTGGISYSVSGIVKQPDRAKVRAAEVSRAGVFMG